MNTYIILGIVVGVIVVLLLLKDFLVGLIKALFFDVIITAIIVGIIYFLKITQIYPYTLYIFIFSMILTIVLYVLSGEWNK